MENNPSAFSPNGDGKDKVAGQSTDQYPVEGVSWFDAVIFCNKLSAKEGRRPFYEIDDKYVRVPDWNGPGYRLPTEAEWEYACRANASTPTRYSFGDDAAQLDEYGWFQVNSSRPHPVGRKKPNGFGLHDMHGNVSEWCWDWYGEGYYKQSREDDPTGPAGPRGPQPGDPGRGWTSGPAGSGPHPATGRADGPLRNGPARPGHARGLSPGPGSVWTLSSGGQGASGAGSRRTGWRHGGAVGRRRSRPRLSWRSKRGKQSVAPLNHKPTTERSTTGAGIMSQEDSALRLRNRASRPRRQERSARGLEGCRNRTKGSLGCIALSFLYVCACVPTFSRSLAEDWPML